jgi:general secretion pathway protein K
MERMHDRHAGIALVLVLWVLALLSTMALALMATQRTETALTRNHISTAQGRALAEAGIYYAIARGLVYRASSDSEKWEPDGTLHPWQFGGSRVETAIISEHAFIDLNFAGAELLDGLLQTAGVDESEIPSLRDAILDWRDENTEHRLRGAEDDAYATEGRAYGAADILFSSVSELRQVLGMTREIYRVVAPALTVYSGKSQVNPWFAPPQVLAALPGMHEDGLADYLELRASHRERGLPPPQPTGVNTALLDLTGGTVFRVYAEAPASDGARVSLQAIVRTGEGAEAYEILAWNHSPVKPILLPISR